MKLTSTSARELVAPGVLKDHVIRGLELRAGALGKSWSVYYRAPCGARRRPKLGGYPAISVDQARELARAVLMRVARGHDPSQDRANFKAAPTVADLFELYMDRHALARKKPASARSDRRTGDKYILPAIGGLKLQSVTLDDIETVIKGVGGRAPVAANRLRALLHTMFEVGAKFRPAWMNGRANPVNHATRYTEFGRKRKIEAHEFEALSAALDELEPRHPRQVAALRCILLCGSRITELVTAPRSALANGVVTLQEHKTMRTGDTREIVLPSQALALIEALPDDGSPLLFGRGVDRFTVHKVWKKARDKAGIPDIRPQDLRRTFGSVGKSSGVALDALGELFGHKSATTTRRYAWLYEDEKRGRAQGVADTLSGLMPHRK